MLFFLISDLNIKNEFSMKLTNYRKINCLHFTILFDSIPFIYFYYKLTKEKKRMLENLSKMKIYYTNNISRK